MIKKVFLSIMILASMGGATAPPSTEESSSLRSIAASTGQIAQTMIGSERRSLSDPLTTSCPAGIDSRNSDLCAQWKAADAADRSAFWAWIGSLGVVIALFLTIWSNHIARDTARRQLRAYMHAQEPDLHPIEFPSGTAWLPEIKWSNAGATPAIEVKAWIGWEIRIGDLPKDWDFECETHQEGFVSVGPGQHWTCSSRSKIPVAIMADISERDERLFMWGRLAYKDAFGKNHTSTIAVEMTSERTADGLFVTNWVALDRHNGIT